MRGFLVLVAVVLASISVGVGVEAATEPAIYGPPGGRFTAAFPSSPTVTSEKPIGQSAPTLIYAAGRHADQLTVTVTVARSGQKGYGLVTPGYQGVAAFASTKGGPRGVPSKVSLRPTQLDGQRVDLGVSCRGRALCVGALFGLTRRVDQRLVGWTATALARSPSLARALVTSLRPLSGAVPASAP